MTLNITVELFTCLFSLICGLVFGTIYDLFDTISAKSNKTGEFIKQVIYFTLTAFLAVNVIRYVNDGNFRIYELIFLVLGIILYNYLLRSTVLKIFIFIFKVFGKIFVFVIKIVIIPLSFLVKPVKFIIKKIFLKFSQKISKNRLTIKGICFRIIMYMSELKRIYKHK